MYSNKDITKTIKEHFPFVTKDQLDKFELLPSLYSGWNEKINVISRKDIDNIFERHILHSLAIAKVCLFKSNSEILDVGTGGGFPGVPLAILFPEVKFHLVDSIGKKIMVVNGVKDSLGLDNLFAEQKRAEQINKRFDFIISRAVTAMPEFVLWVKDKISKVEYHDIENGILYLKGGDLKEELSPFTNKKGNKVTLYDIHDFFPSEFFQTKKVVHLKLK